MSSDLFKIQEAFTQRIRHPKKAPLPEGVNQERMAVYEQLIPGGLHECLEVAFPVLSEVISEDCKNSIVKGFLETHAAKTPLFHEIPEAFLVYLMQERDDPNDPPFLAELAHFEWMELAIELLDEPAESEAANDTDVLTPRALLEVVGYTYPVHEISQNYQPTIQDKGQYFFASYRDDEGQVQFLELSLFATRLLQLLQQYELTQAKVTSLLAEEMQRAVDANFEAEVQSVVDELREAQVL